MVLAAVCGIFADTCRILSYSVWNLVAWPGIEPGPPALGAWSLNHWTTREVPLYLILICFSLITRRITSDAKNPSHFRYLDIYISCTVNSSVILLRIFSPSVCFVLQALFMVPKPDRHFNLFFAFIICVYSTFKKTISLFLFWWLLWGTSVTLLFYSWETPFSWPSLWNSSSFCRLFEM